MSYLYQTEIELGFAQVDRATKLSLTAAQSLTQEMTMGLFCDNGWDNLSIYEKYGAMWVITKTRLHFYHIPSWRDKITGKSYIVRGSGLRPQNECAFIAGEEKLFTVRQELCVLNKNERTILSSETIENLAEAEQAPQDRGLAFYDLHQSYSEEDLVYSGHFRQNDIDVSRHVNNVILVRYLTDALDWSSLEKMKITDMEIHYRRECREGSEFSVYKKQRDGVTDLMLTRDGEEAVYARIVSE